MGCRGSEAVRITPAVNPIQFLLDENVPPRLRRALARHWPEIVVWMVGDEDAPPLGTLDPEILVWCEANGFALVTYNRSSMPLHLQAHLDVGRHVSGIFVLSESLSIGAIVDDLSLIWGASFPGEFADQIQHLPLTSR